MIREFIYKYYIDPIIYGQPYNIVDTLTYALVLIVAIYIIYRWLSASRIVRVDSRFILATLPFVVLGGLSRVVQDTGMITSGWQFLLVTPLIYFVLFFFTVVALLSSAYLQKRGLVRDYAPVYAGTGIVSCILVSGLLVWFGMQNGTISLPVLGTIMGMAVLSTLAVYGAMRYILGWTYAADPLYLSLVFGQLLDASATSYGIDLHPLDYAEVHVVGSTMIDLTGTAFVMFPLKLAVLFPGVWVLQRYRSESPEALWHLILLAMITVGLAPGVRDMVRMVLYV
jgi:uncharacterized membrane protein